MLKLNVGNSVVYLDVSSIISIEHQTNNLILCFQGGSMIPLVFEDMQEAKIVRDTIIANHEEFMENNFNFKVVQPPKLSNRATTDSTIIPFPYKEPAPVSIPDDNDAISPDEYLDDED